MHVCFPLKYLELHIKDCSAKYKIHEKMATYFTSPWLWSVSLTDKYKPFRDSETAEVFERKACLKQKALTVSEHKYINILNIKILYWIIYFYIRRSSSGRKSHYNIFWKYEDMYLDSNEPSSARITPHSLFLPLSASLPDWIASSGTAQQKWKRLTPMPTVIIIPI